MPVSTSPRVWCALALLCLTATGCVSQTVKTVHTEPLRTVAAIPEAELMDVGVHIFDPNIPDDWEAREEENILPDVRRAEARYMPQVLKATLENSGNWGAVRVLPRDTAAVDLAVDGRIIESTGERLILDVVATDATGRVWVDARYDHQTSKYVYEQESARETDPFQAVYVQIANDLTEARQRLAPEDRKRIRQVAEIRFAREFAPDAFDGYVEQDARGRWQLLRLPAETDPMLARVRRVREREYLFIDTLDEYYGEFRRDMQQSYQDYRRFTYQEAVNLRELKAESRRRAIIGAIAVVGGVAAAVSGEDQYVRSAGAVAVAAGGYALKSAFDKNAESKIHAEAIRELGTSLEAEVSPHVIELDDRTITLTGTVDEQYEAWRDILRELYRTDVGLPPMEDDAAAADAREQRPLAGQAPTAGP